MKSNVHRLPDDRYSGRVTVHFTACLQNRARWFTTEERVAPHRTALREEIERARCVAYVYCFMPDHLHAIVLGISDDAEPRRAFQRFKQRSGYLLRGSTASWQKSFYDHILRPNEDAPAQVLYVMNNPLRSGLIDDPLRYPFSGCIGTDYREVLETTIDL